MHFTDKPTLTGSAVVLRPFAEADADVMWEIFGDEEVQRLTFEPTSVLTLDSVRTWYGSRASAEDRLDLAVIDRGTGRLVGEVVLHGWDPRTRACSFRTLVGPLGRGRGLGTEATRLILGYGFEQGVHRVELEVYRHNTRARRVYDKVGFVEEGVRREAHYRYGEWVDVVMMALLDREWRS